MSHWFTVFIKCLWKCLQDDNSCYCSLKWFYTKKKRDLVHSVYSLKNFLPQYCKVLGIQTARFSNKKPKWSKNKPTTIKNKHNSNKKKPYTCSILQTPTIVAKIQAFFHSSHTLFLLIQIDYQTRLFYFIIILFF